MSFCEVLSILREEPTGRSRGRIDKSEVLESSLLLKIKSKDQPPDLQGVDLTPVLKDQNQKVRECCLVEHDEEVAQFNLIVRLRHLITEKYKLTVYENRKGYGDLFDRKKDPYELNNLWYSNPELRHELMEQLFYENLSAQSRYPKRLSMS